MNRRRRKALLRELDDLRAYRAAVYAFQFRGAKEARYNEIIHLLYA